MRYFLMAAAVVVVGLGVAIYFSWNSISDFASEVAAESGKELGRVSYHASRCGNKELMSQFETSMDQFDQISQDFQADMQAAFKVGVEEARSMNIEYTEEFCAEIEKTIQAAQNG